MVKKPILFKRILVFGILVLFIGAGIVPSIVGMRKQKTSIPSIVSPGYIQDLIDNASDGDTINIPSGTYYENIVINKSISLIGEDKEKTIIDGGNNGTVIRISINKVTVSGFTIQNGDDGIGLYRSNRTSIIGNIISNNGDGIYLNGCSGNNIKYNIISNNGDGIILSHNGYIVIIKNNFQDNKRDAFFYNSYLNLWWRNYWNKSRILPKLIHGEIILSSGGWGLPRIWIPWFNIDWRPALTLNDI